MPTTGERVTYSSMNIIEDKIELSIKPWFKCELSKSHSNIPKTLLASTFSRKCYYDANGKRVGGGGARVRGDEHGGAPKKRVNYLTQLFSTVLFHSKQNANRNKKTRNKNEAKGTGRTSEIWISIKFLLQSIACPAKLIAQWKMKIL